MTDRCPRCGGSLLVESESPYEPSGDYSPGGTMEALGYAHTDITYRCDSCDAMFTRGVPEGSYEKERRKEIICELCGAVGTVHRVNVHPEEVENEGITIDFKCPECYNFWTKNRESSDDGRGIYLIGNPKTTGSMEVNK